MLQGRKGEGPASWLQASFPSFLGWIDLPDTGWWSPWLRKIDLYLGSGFISVMNKLSGFGPLNLLTIEWGTLSGKDEGHFQP